MSAHRIVRAAELGSGVGVLALLLLTAGCLGRSPSPDHFVLGAADRGTPGDAAPEVSMLVGPVRLPAYLDRPQFARLDENGEVSLDEFSRWLGGFEANLLRSLSLEIAQLTGSIEITTHPSRAPFPFDATLRLHVDDLVVVEDALRVRIRWALVRSEEGHSPVLGLVEERIPLEGPTNADVVAAHEVAIGALAAAVVAALDY